MTSLLEKIIANIAPHRCIVCSNTNNVLCKACLADLPRSESICVFCGKPCNNWRPCAMHAALLQQVWVAHTYEGAVAEIIKRFKFGGARAAHLPLAAMLHAALPYFDDDLLVTAVPTVPQHIRRRGYDHAKLVAQAFAKQRSLPYAPLLRRRVSGQQVGANRQQRLAQMQGAFYVSRELPKGKQILIIDDVCTTGATLAAAAATLKKAGATEVSAAVVAWREPNT